ncbi:MAG: PhzF family phenazine biosynthesis protein [Ardenticatenaceae bacterium]|nr:PhzF family phenazine biosynthesis protein [Ardenticatenaceae bacterium]
MKMNLFQVDAFTDTPFTGNPAAVCLLDEVRDDEWMRHLAQEMNLSETAFLLPQDDGFSLRWFTPTTEVNLCGHATLASAHVLWETGILAADEVARFYTRSGLLTAVHHPPIIELNFPAQIQTPVEAPPELMAALGVTPVYVGQCGNKYLIEVADETIVRQLQPNFAALRQMPGRGVAVTSASFALEFDFVSRYFAPWVGIDEDPVTGSIHCCLGPFWGARLGKKTLTAYQASPRGGVLQIRLAGERVYLGGQSVTIFHGVLAVR